MISRAKGMPLQIRVISVIAGLIPAAHRVNRVCASKLSMGSSTMATMLGIEIGFTEVIIKSHDEGGARGLTCLVLEALSRIKMPLCGFKAAR